MADRMLQFVRLSQAQPEKRGVGDRRRDFDEIYGEFEPAAAAEQASRCSQCGVPFCQVHCPLQNNIPDWLKLTAEGRLEEAYEVAAATNNLPEICGRICPQDRLCEGNCVIEQGVDGTVTIGAVEKYITDTAWERRLGHAAPPARRTRQQSVGIIGAGPAGLAAAEHLRPRGYEVHVYDRHDRVGGLMIYGIPNFKLEKDVVMRRLAAARARAGSSSTRTSRSAATSSLADLRERHDAVLIAHRRLQGARHQAPGVGSRHRRRRSTT